MIKNSFAIRNGISRQSKTELYLLLFLVIDSLFFFFFNLNILNLGK